jgi:hypothetical protein
MDIRSKHLSSEDRGVILHAAVRKSMTYDRGSDPLMVCEQTTAGQWMACHPEMALRLKIDIWFCDPHADVYFGRDKAILREREKIKKKTIRQRRLQHQKQAT